MTLNVLPFILICLACAIPHGIIALLQQGKIDEFQAIANKFQKTLAGIQLLDKQFTSAAAFADDLEGIKSYMEARDGQIHTLIASTRKLHDEYKAGRGDLSHFFGELEKVVTDLKHSSEVIDHNLVQLQQILHTHDIQLSRRGHFSFGNYGSSDESKA
ncbi:hypothetical protein ACFO5Q_04435 [Kordiimonas lipolytica]|uniref:Uncharacterized protein n=1 Tax=Kordiimonas lipolytica TaxID=1662421 RepID=A0ABV8U9D0_9PROT|nr:hypothetical protein [Kordiimonas lipolytica]